MKLDQASLKEYDKEQQCFIGLIWQILKNSEAYGNRRTFVEIVYKESSKASLSLRVFSDVCSCRMNYDRGHKHGLIWINI